MNWSGVRERVLALQKAPGAAKVFGAGGHGFRLDPPLREAEVAQAEAELGVSFPPAYRSFLLEVSAGGAGPDYGLYPLRRDEREWHWVALGRTREVNPLLGQPFPSEADRARWTEQLDAREPRAEDFPDEDAHRAAFDAWNDEWEPLNAAMTAGAVCLGHQGCGYFTWLAVTGPASGTLWNDLRAADDPLEPLSLDFPAWYLTWLRHATREAARA